MAPFEACDACGHRSFVFADLPSGGTLSYCGHHGAAFIDGLTYAGADILDLRYMIGTS